MKHLLGVISLLLIATSLSFSSSITAQTPPDSLESLESKALRVYIDCDLCDLSDFDYIRTEIAFVNYVRERKESQVHLLITTQETGGGGTEFTIRFPVSRAAKIFTAWP